MTCKFPFQDGCKFFVREGNNSVLCKFHDKWVSYNFCSRCKIGEGGSGEDLLAKVLASDQREANK